MENVIASCFIDIVITSVVVIIVKLIVKSTACYNIIVIKQRKVPVLLKMSNCFRNS